MDPRPITEAGKPSPLVQRAIDRRRLRKPIQEPSTGTLSSDNDNAGGGVSLRPYKSKAKPATAMAGSARGATIAADDVKATADGVLIATPKGTGHKPNLSVSSVLSQQSPAVDHAASIGSSSDHGSAASKGNNDNSGGTDQVMQPVATDYFTTAGTAGQDQHQVPKLSAKSNLTASAKAFVPQSAQQDETNAPPKPLLESTTSPQIYYQAEAINNPAGATTGNMDSGDSTFLNSPPNASEREDAFASQFDNSHKLLGLIRPADNDGTSTPGHYGSALQGSHQLFGSSSPINTTATPSVIAASSSPTRGWGLGYTGNGLLGATNTSASQVPRSGSVTGLVAHQPQQQGAPTSVSSWVKHRLANNPSLGPSNPMTQMDDDKYGPQGGGPPPPPIAKAGQGNQATPVRGLQMTNTWNGQYSPGQYSPSQYSPSRFNGIGGRNPNIHPTNLSYNRPYAPRLPATSKATDQDLADCRQHLINFATQSPLTKGITSTADATSNYSPTRINGPPAGYRAGLPGSASESALFYYSQRQPTTPSRRGDNDGNNNQVMIAPVLSPVPAGYGNVHEEAVVFEAPSEETRKMRSPELNELVGPSGVPSLVRLRGPVFPFEPSGGMKAKRGEGVVHYLNVSLPSSSILYSLSLIPPYPLLLDDFTPCCACCFCSSVS